MTRSSDLSRGVFVVTGASSGLGREIAYFLNSYGYEVSNWSLDRDVDVQDEISVRKAADAIIKSGDNVAGLVNCAGVNYIDWFSKITLADWDRVMNTNARGIFLVSRTLLPVLKGKVICNIISNASHVPMTNSAAYNASKGAAHILTLQMGRELKKTDGITVFGVSPNKLAGTKMSAEIENRVCDLRNWSPEEAKRYQLAALPAGRETDPEVCASFIGFILNNPDIYECLNCCVLPFGA